MDMDDLLDLLTDMKVLFEQPVPFSLITNSDMIVSVLLQITHSLVHDERQPIRQILDAFPESVLSQYVEKALQEPILEDRLCACLTLAEQVQLLSLTIPTDVREQLLVWMQTYMSARLRQRLMSDNGPDGR